MSPAPKEPAGSKKPAAPKRRAKPRPAAEPVAVARSAGAASVVPAGAGAPALSAGTGQVVAGGSAGPPLPVLTRPAARAPRVVAAVQGRTPGTALPRGADIDEPWPKPLEIARVAPAPLETGMSDYAFWLAHLAGYEPPPPTAGGYRQGEIWA